jgi:Cof subfamily protein (haloacid dehalogenase superfamily)
MSVQTPTPQIKLIAIDIDGTLLNSQNQLSERNEKALKAAIAKGVQIVLATGKTRPSADWINARLGLTAPGIFLQGQIAYDADGKVRYQQTLSPAIARQVLTFAEDRGFLMVAYSGSRILVRAANPALADGITKYHEPQYEVVGPLQNILDSVPINKLMAIGEPRSIAALRWQLSTQLNGSARLMQAGLSNMVEVLPQGGSKGNALKHLLKELKIAPENVMAMGDAENDMEMIQLAGIGVAIGNAEAKLKEAAKYTVASNDQDGVAEAIERFVLAEPKPAPAAASTSPASPAATPAAKPEAKTEAKPEVKPS